MRFPDVLLITAAVWTALALGLEGWNIYTRLDFLRAAGVPVALESMRSLAQTLLLGLLAVGGAVAIRILERIEQRLPRS